MHEFPIEEVNEGFGVHPFKIFSVDLEIGAAPAVPGASAPAQGAVESMFLQIFLNDFQIAFVSAGKTGTAHANDDGMFLHRFTQPFFFPSAADSPAEPDSTAKLKSAIEAASLY